MNILKKLEKLFFPIILLNFVSVIFLWGQTSGVGTVLNQFRLTPPGSDIVGMSLPENISMRYGAISLCFLICIVLNLIYDKLPAKIISLILFSFIILQFTILLMLKTDILEIGWKYDEWLRGTFYKDIFHIFTTVLLLLIKVCSLFTKPN